MFKVNDFLLNLGLNGKEIKVFLALLELGNQPASIIAKKAGFPRSSTIFTLDCLAKKGFAIKGASIGQTTYYSPINPTKIKDLLNHKQQRIQNQIAELDKLAPEFKNLVNNFLPQSKICYFEGVEGVCKMIELITENDTPLYFISGHEFHPEIDKYIKNVYTPRRKKMKTKCQMIISKTEKAKSYIEASPDVYEWIAYAINTKNTLESTIVIYEDKIQFQNCHGDSIGGVLIENQYLAQTMLTVFNLLKNTKRIEEIS